MDPVLPLVTLAGPFLFAAAPKISELIVNAITDQIAKGSGKDNLCDGMTAAALRSSATVAAPGMAWQLPTMPNPSAPPATIPNLSPVAFGTDEPVAVDASSLPSGAYLLEPIVMAASPIRGTRVPRTLPNPDGSAASAVPFRVNPTIPIRDRNAQSGFGCGRMRAEGDRVELESALSAVLSRGIQSVE